jgi:cystathionine beta-lyase
LVDFFINHAGLALNDGSMFGKEGRGFMRFNAAAPRATIDEAIKKIADALATFKK